MTKTELIKNQCKHLHLSALSANLDEVIAHSRNRAGKLPGTH